MPTPTALHFRTHAGRLSHQQKPTGLASGISTPVSVSAWVRVCVYPSVSGSVSIVWNTSSAMCLLKVDLFAYFSL